VWADGGGTGWNIVGQKLDNTGARQWGVEGLTVCGATDTQLEPVLTDDGAGGIYVAWQDTRVRPVDQIYATRINAAGTVLWAADGLTPVLASLVQARVQNGVARIEWLVAPSAAVRVERSEGDGWSERSRLTADGTGRVVFEDASLGSTPRAGWRLRIGEGTAAPIAGEVWLDLGRAHVLALEGARPNPGGPNLVASFSLASSAPATLEVLDLQGRRLWSREVGAFGPGSHLLPFDAEELGAAGVHFLRLRQGQRSLTAKFTTMR
jgi:hypothetical protein